MTPCTEAPQASLSITSSQSLLRLTSIESVMPSSHLILCHPFLLLPPIPPSIRAFFNESTLCMRWPKYWSFSFSISPSKEHPGLISFRIDWLDLLAVQGTLKSLFQHHSSKASIQFSSVAQSCPTLCDPMNRSTPGLPVHHQFPEFTQIMSIRFFDATHHLILCHPILLQPSIFPSIRVFSSESVLHIRWPKYWSFSFSISPSNEHSGLISFRIDWLDLLAVQGTLKSLLQHQFKSINSSALSFLYSSTLTSIHDYWKNHTLD